MDFAELAAERYSVRKYQKKEIEAEKIEKMLDVAKLAPTARNIQPHKIYVVTSEEKRKALAEVCDCTFDAPVIFVIGYDDNLVGQGIVEENYNSGTTDCAIVTSHLMFEAAELGLGSCWVGRFRSEDVKRVLSLPDNIRVRNLLPVGYPAKDSVPSERHTSYRDSKEIVQFM